MQHTQEVAMRVLEDGWAAREELQCSLRKLEQQIERSMRLCEPPLFTYDPACRKPLRDSAFLKNKQPETNAKRHLVCCGAKSRVSIKLFMILVGAFAR